MFSFSLCDTGFYRAHLLHLVLPYLNTYLVVCPYVRNPLPDQDHVTRSQLLRKLLSRMVRHMVQMNSVRMCVLIVHLHLVTPLEGPRVPDGLSAQRAAATIFSRAEVKLGPCAQLSEAGS